MNGTIGFDQLRIKCVIGVTEEERRSEQEILVDLRVKIDISGCVFTDNLQYTICYTELAKICTDIATKGRFHLLEKFGYDVIQQILKKYEAESVWIRIKKPSALPAAQCAVVELEGFKS